MRIVIIRPWTHDPYVEKWAEAVEEGIAPLVGKKITHCGVYPEPSDSDNPLDYIQEVVRELRGLPVEDETVYIMFAPDGESHAVASVVMNIMSITHMAANNIIYFSNQPMQSVPNNMFVLCPKSLAGNYQQAMMSGQASTSYPPVPMSIVLKPDTSEAANAVYVALTVPSLDLIYPIAIWAKELDVECVVEIRHNIPPDMVEYINAVPNVRTTKSITANLAGNGDIYIGDTYNVVLAMQNDAHVIVPRYAQFLFDVIGVRKEHILMDIEKDKIQAAISAPRHCASMVDDNEFIQKITEVLIGKEKDPNLVGLGG